MHRFEYRVFMMYLDLAELDTVFAGRWLWSTNRPAMARFRRADHLGPAAESLDRSVRRLVGRRTGREPAGPIRLLTHLRYFGYCFNPVSFYYCYAADGETLEAIVAEVNNTPWNEQHCYVLPDALNVGRGAAWRFRPAKDMHVSPFIGMDVDYDWTFTQPGSRLTVFMATSRNGERFFDASMNMRKTEITGRSLARVLVAFPLMTLKVIAAIHWQAFRLGWKRCPVHRHPRKRSRVLSEQR
jgi:DUF1365 family protein